MDPRPDRLFVHARIWTGDEAAPHAEALAVARGRIVAIGSASSMRNAAPGLPAEDLGGGWVTPGFHDAHLHLATGALLQDQVDLRSARSAADAAARIAQAARPLAPGEWIRAWGWDHSRWPGAAWPERGLLDRAVPAHPVVATRIDGHAAWVNGATLARLAEGRGESGLLLEQAAERAVAAVPPPGEARRRSALRAALDEVRSVGITSVEDVTEPWALAHYAALHEAGELTARIGAWLPIETDAVVREELRRAFPPDDPWISVGTLKGFLDGTLGSRSAALHAPYADEPSSAGILRIDPAELAEQVRRADDAGWTVALHAIGDRALSVALDTFEALPKRPRARPHRVEHVQLAAPRDLARFARVGLLASIQPVHLLDDRAWVASRLGATRDAIAYPWRSLFDAGIGVAFGSDWPIAPLDPRLGIRAAVDRRLDDLGPGEALSAEEAVRGYTSGSARARGVATRTGILRAGFPADFVVWSSNPAEAVSGQVLSTFVSGRRVWPELEPPPDV